MCFSKLVTLHAAAALTFMICTASINCARLSKDDKETLKNKAVITKVLLAVNPQKMNPKTTQEAGKKPGKAGAETKPTFSNDTGESSEAGASVKPRRVPEGDGETDTGGSTDGSDVPSRK